MKLKKNNSLFASILRKSLNFIGVEGKNALIYAENLRKKVEGDITVSIGVAEYKYNQEPEAFLKRADLAMYTAKRKGRNKVVAAV